MAGKSLDELYSDVAAEPSQSTAPGVEPQQAAEPAAPAQGAAVQQAKAEIAGAPPAPEAKDQGQHVPLAALEDERRKRKELEKRFEELERRTAPQQRRETVDPLIDPDAFVREQQVGRFEDRLAITTEFLIEKEGEEAWAAAERAVIQAATRDPRFAQAFAEGVAHARNPAKYSYETGKKLIEQAEAADPAKLRDRLKAEILAELGHLPQQGQQQAQQPASAPAPRVPPSLASVQSQGPRNPGPRPIKRRSLEELYR